jgi:hypothetical protein
VGAILHIAQASSFESRPSALRRVLPSEALAPIAATIDAGMLLLASGLATLFYRLYADEPAATPSGSLGVGLTAAVLFILIARTQGLYRFEALVEPASRLARVAFALALSLLVLTFILFLLKVGAEYSRLATIAFATLAAVLAPMGRLTLGAAARAGVRSGVVRGRPAPHVSIGERPQPLAGLRSETSPGGPRPRALAHDDGREARFDNHALCRRVKPRPTGSAWIAILRGKYFADAASGC